MALTSKSVGRYFRCRDCCQLLGDRSSMGKALGSGAAAGDVCASNFRLTEMRKV